MGPTPVTTTVGVEESPMALQPTPVPSWQLIPGQGKGMGGEGGRRVVVAYHHQLQVPGVVLQHHPQSKGNRGAVEVHHHC